MAHELIPGIDRVAASNADTIWHSKETKANGVLHEIAASDPESMALASIAIVFPSDRDNDIARLVALRTIDGTDVPTHFAAVSPSGRILSVVTDTFAEIPFAMLSTEWFLALARAGGIPETLGTYSGGVNMFASLRVAESWRVPGDHSETRPMFNMLASHENGVGIRGSFGTFRVVCKNTANMYADAHRAIGADAKERANAAWVCVKHTLNARERIQDAVAWIVDGRARAESERATLERLATKLITPSEIETFLASYIATDGVSPRATTIRENQRDAFIRAAKDVTDLGNHALTGSGMSAYGLLQAVTHFEDHVARVVAPDHQVATRRAFRAFTGAKEADKATARAWIEELVSTR